MIRELVIAQVTYTLMAGKGNFASTTLDLRQATDNNKLYFNQSIIKMQTEPQYGYLIGRIKTTPVTVSQQPTFSAVAVPVLQYGLFYAGNDCFYIDQTGIIRHSGSPTKIPDASSPPVE